MTPSGVQTEQNPEALEAMPAWRTLCGVLGLCGWMFALFGATASAARLGMAYTAPGSAEAVPLSGLWLRVAGFSVLAAVLGIGLWRWGRGKNNIPLAPPSKGESKGWRSVVPYAGLALGLLFATLLAFPRLDAWPWAAPDEIHHLTVAKNLALYGEYASGGPAEGFKRFDAYDSVGPPVLAPVAGAFRCFGVSVAAGRWVIGLYLLWLSTGAFFLAWRTYGAAAAVAVVFLTPTAFSTIYLARTLYGEVPALAWWVWGLLCWRKAVDNPRCVFAGLAAGVAFGVAVLCKTVFVLSAFAFLAAWFWDRLGPKRISKSALAYPALGAMAPIAVWWMVQSFGQGDVAEGAASTLGVYQYHLLFGIRSFLGSLGRWWYDYPLSHWVTLAALIWAVPVVFSRRYDPASMALFLTAVFFGLWWLFFTPGRLPRYYWVGNWAMAWFTAPLWTICLRQVWRADGLVKRVAALLGVALLSVTPLQWTWNQGREICVNEEMREDAAVAALAGSLPPETSMAVTFGPLRETLHFFTGRTWPLTSSQPDPLEHHEVVAGLGTDPVFVSGYRCVVGRYVIRSRQPLAPLFGKESAP